MLPRESASHSPIHPLALPPTLKTQGQTHPQSGTRHICQCFVLACTHCPVRSLFVFLHVPDLPYTPSASSSAPLTLQCQTPSIFPACSPGARPLPYLFRPGCGLSPPLPPLVEGAWEGGRSGREGSTYPPLDQHSLSAYNPVPAAELPPSP